MSANDEANDESTFGLIIKHRTIVAVGSNIEPTENVRRAGQILGEEQNLLDSSSFIVTDPVGYSEQADFLNGAFYLETELTFGEFNEYLKGMELRLGRVKGPIKSGPRTIDLDITVWDRRIVHEDYFHHDHTRLPVQEIIDRQKIEIENSEIVQ